MVYGYTELEKLRFEKQLDLFFIINLKKIKIKIKQQITSCKIALFK